MRAGLNRSAAPTEKPREHANEPATRHCHRRVGVREPVMRSEEAAREPMENLPTTGAKPRTGGPDGQLNSARSAITLSSGQSREDCGNRISRDPIQRVLELRVAFDWEDVGSELQLGGPVLMIWGMRIVCVVAQEVDLAVGVLREELLLDCRSQFGRKRTREANGLVVLT